MKGAFQILTLCSALTRNDCQQDLNDCHAKKETRENGKAHQSPIIINRLFLLYKE